ncbi:hypothetical protein [Nocardioides sp. GXZ039]|uniref:hypothetical protein n=1 Tax=Nocardioides sp. GXZ039 TaxID=3136018 RepID=UPI0030F3F558
MIESKKRDAGLGILGGMATGLLSTAFHLQGGARMPAIMLGAGLYAWGAMSLAEAKGYSQWWGLLALITVVGMLVLVCLPDRRRGALVDL